MIHFIQAHPALAGISAYFLFSNVIGAMDKPDEKSSQLYRYVYKLGHGLAGNLKYALQSKFPEYVPKDDPKP